MWCPSATANHLHTAAYWLTLAVRDAISHTDSLAKAELAIFRERLIKVGARAIEHTARLRIQWPDRFPRGSVVPRPRDCLSPEFASTTATIETAILERSPFKH